MSRTAKVHKKNMWEAQEGLCAYCQKPMRGYRRHRGDYALPDDWATVDHVVPKSQLSKDGLPNSVHHIDNLVLACHKCNREKGDQVL